MSLRICPVLLLLWLAAALPALAESLPVREGEAPETAGEAVPAVGVDDFAKPDALAELDAFVGRAAVGADSGAGATGATNTSATQPPDSDAERRAFVSAHNVFAGRNANAVVNSVNKHIAAVATESNRDYRRNDFDFTLNFGNVATNTASARSRYHPRGPEAASASLDIAAVAASLTSLASAPPSADAYSKRLAFWGDCVVDLDLDAPGGVGLDEGKYTMLLGTDYSVTDALTLGLAGSYGYGGDAVAAEGAIADNAYSASFYGVYALPAGFSLAGSIGYSTMDLSTRRPTRFSQSQPDGAGDQYLATLSINQRRQWKRLLLNPYAHADAARTRFASGQGIAPDGSRPLGQFDMFALSTGLRGEYAIETDWGSLIPSAGTELIYNAPNDAGVALGCAGALSDLPYMSTPEGSAGGLFGVDAGLAARFKSDMQIDLRCRERFAREDRFFDMSLQFSVKW